MADKVLIIDANSKMRKHYAEILEFLGHESVVLADVGACKSHFEKQANIWLIMLANCGTGKETLAAYRAIKEIDKHLPIIQIINPDNQARYSQELVNGCIAQLELPLRHQLFAGWVQRQCADLPY